MNMGQCWAVIGNMAVKDSEGEHGTVMDSDSEHGTALNSDSMHGAELDSACEVGTALGSTHSRIVLLILSYLLD